MCKKSTTKQETSNAIPAWLTEASQYAVGKAKNLADKPFEAYGGKRVADFSPDQLNAFQQLRTLIAGAPNIGGEAIDGARRYANAGPQKITAQTVTPETIKASLGDISAYFNPNTEAALQPALRKIDEAAGNSFKRVNAAATGARAFGDARHGIAESEVDKNRVLAHGDTASQAYQAMYDKALATLGGDVDRRNSGQLVNAQFASDADKSNAAFNEQALTRLLTGSTAMMDLSQKDQNRQLQQIQALLGTGALQQGHGQAGLDADFQEFMRKYGHDFQTLNAFNSTIKGIPHDTKQTTTNTQPDNSGIGALGSAAGAVASNPAFWGWLAAL